MKKNNFIASFIVAVSVLLLIPVAASAQNSAQSSQLLQSTVNTTVIAPNGSGETPGRAFPIGGQTSFPGTANYWGTILSDGRFEPLSDILIFQKTWTEEEAIALTEQKGGKVKCNVPEKSPKDGEPTKSIMFIMSKPKDEQELAKFNAIYEFIKPGYFYSENRAVTSKVFGEAILYGLKCGADVVLYAEGFSLRLEGESLGIGISPSVVVSGGGVNSTAAGGVMGAGIGWSKAWAEYYSKPWLRVKYFKKRVSNGKKDEQEISKENVVPAETKNGKLFQPEIASPPELQTGVNSAKEKDERKLSPAVVKP